MEEMISVIREVFISNLDHLRWMDVETKKAAEEKVRLTCRFPPVDLERIFLSVSVLPVRLSSTCLF